MTTERPTGANLGPQDQAMVDVVIRDVYAVREPDGFLRINVGPATAIIDPDAKNVTVTSRIEREADDDRD